MRQMLLTEPWNLPNFDWKHSAKLTETNSSLERKKRITAINKAIQHTKLNKELPKLATMVLPLSTETGNNGLYPTLDLKFDHVIATRNKFCEAGNCRKTAIFRKFVSPLAL